MRLVNFQPSQFIMRSLVVQIMASPQVASCRHHVPLHVHRHIPNIEAFAAVFPVRGSCMGAVSCPRTARSLFVRRMSMSGGAEDAGEITMPLQDTATTPELMGPRVLYRDDNRWYDYDDFGDGDERYVFRPQLQWDQSYNIIHTGRDLGPDAATYVEKLVRSRMNGMEQMIFGNEEDDVWRPFIMPWGKEQAVTAESVLSELGAHERIQTCKPFLRRVTFPPSLLSWGEADTDPQYLRDCLADADLSSISDPLLTMQITTTKKLKNKPSGQIGKIMDTLDLDELSCKKFFGVYKMLHREEEEKIDALEEKGEIWDLFEAFDEERTPAMVKDMIEEAGLESPICFYAGQDRLNPVPVFVVGRLSSSTIGGFMTTIVKT